jgi:hypothetical protein
MAEHVQVQSYRDLEVYQLAFSGALKVHEMTMGLPKHEMYNEYLYFLTVALASCDETQVHLEMLHATAGLDDLTFESLSNLYSTLGRKLNRLVQSVLAQHVEPYRDRSGDQLRENGPDYLLDEEG